MKGQLTLSDMQEHRYWDMTISGAPITPSRTSILETIPKVISSPPKISSKSSTGWPQRVFYFFSKLLTSHPYWSVIFLTAVVLLAWSSRPVKGGGGRRRGLSLSLPSLGNVGGAGGKGGFLGLDEKKGGWEGRVAQLTGGGGGVGNGKAD